MTPVRTGAPSARSRWRWLALWSVCCVVALGAAFALGTLVRSPWEQAIENSTTAPLVTARAETRRLVQDGAVLDGTVAIGTTTQVMAVTSDVAVITATRRAPGETLMPGEALADVSGRPLVALTLPFRLYRDLAPGSSGPDVTAVQQALIDLGLLSGAADGTYGRATAEAVERLYTRVSLAPPVAAAELISTSETADAAAEQARTALAAAEQALASATQAAPATDASAEAASWLATATQERDTARREQESTQRAADAARLATATPLPMGEVVRVPADGVTVVDIAPVGTELAAEEAPVARLRSGAPTATVRVGAGDADAFVAGTEVTLAAATDTARAVTGTVSAVGAFVSTATESGAPPGYDLEIALPSDQPFSEGEQVTATATATEEIVEGLTVPLVALREDSDGPYVLVPSATADETPRRTTVTVVATVGGYAVVSGDDVTEGTTVVVSDGR